MKNRIITGTKKLNKKLAENKAVHNYMDEDGNLIQIITDFKIRNYETILKQEDKKTHCKCGGKLSTKNVNFSPNGMSRTKIFTVQFCKKCDSVPPDFSTMWVLKNDNFDTLDI